MSEDLKKAVLKRKCLRISSTKTVEGLKILLEAQTKDEDKICSKVEILREMVGKLEALDEEVQRILSDDETAFLADVEECQIRMGQMREFVHAGERVLREIGEAASSERSFLSRLNQVQTPSYSKPTGVKLPTIALPTFEGDPLKWTPFWDIFKSTIHSCPGIAPSQKFSYLQGQLRGEAKRLIAGFPATDTYYDEAVELLEKTYGRPYIIIREHIHAILDIPVPKVTSYDLQDFMSSYECHLRSLKALKVNVDEAGFLFTAILLRKLPRRVYDNINRAAQADTWTLTSFREAMEKEIKLLSACEPERRDGAPRVPRDTKKQDLRSSPTRKITTGNFHMGEGRTAYFVEAVIPRLNATKK